MDEKYEQQFKKGALDMVLLSIISRKRTYGYEMLLDLSRAGGPLFQNIKVGTLYPVLYRLEDSGFITSEVSVSEPGGRPKKFYQITDSGVRALAEMKAFWASFKNCVDDLLEE